jgi:hypothetical protein
MKSILTFLSFFSLSSAALTTYSQCTVTPTNIKAVTTNVSTVGSNCVYTINVTIDFTHNNGFKWAFLYFYDGSSVPAGISQTPSSSDAVQPGAFALISPTYQVSSSVVNGISPQTGYTIIRTPITGGSRYTITNLKFSRPGVCSPSSISSDISLYVGGANSNSLNIQCTGSLTFRAYKVLVSGKVNCSSPRNYDLIIDTDYEIGGSATAVSGTYEVFIDQDNDGVIDAGETKITASSLFNTSGTTPLNRFSSFLNTYGTSTNGDLNTGANLLVSVQPSTLGVAPLVGRLGNACGVLPIVLKNFNAKLNNNAVALTWETADEINNKGFEIQRRLNGEATYQKIAFVDAKATQGLGASYSFTDVNARNKGSVSYRLAQTDIDGKISLSEIRIVNTGAGNSQIAVYPNPSKGTVRVSLPTQVSKADISLEDFSGKTIQRWNAYSANTLQIDQIRPGIYLIRVRLQETGEQMIERLIVQ